MRPLIAVTAPVKESELGIPQVVLESGYLAAAEIARGHSLVLSHALGPTAGEMFARADGLLLTGGEDVHPERYGEELKGTRRTSPPRDELEIALARRAIETGVPLLAICRGMQLLNVALGGSLYQDLATDRDADIDHDRWRDVDEGIHEIRVEGEERLAGVFEERTFLQNSAHHQGVRDLAPGLRAVGWAPDGLVEAVELTAAPAWTAGVQWHPERKLEEASGTNRRLFERFGAEVRRASARGARASGAPGQTAGGESGAGPAALSGGGAG
ncbi:MAG: gamma-glutamyl-gamma-aminobutyrate hydrolase family protein [Gemmatimonadota bacterium]